MSPLKLHFFNKFEGNHLLCVMKNEKSLWIKAEEDFHRWIEEPALYPENEHTNLRKAIHIVFRRKYYDQLTPVLKKVFEITPPDKLLNEEDSTVAQEGIFLNQDINFSKSYYSQRLSYEEENKQILDGLWKDDYTAISEFYENNFYKIASLILKNSGTIDDAKDIFQDAIVVLMDKYTWGKLDIITCSIGTYIYSISRNLWYSHLRTLKKEQEFIDLENGYSIDISTEYYAEEPDDFEKVNNIVLGLGNPCKELLELFYFENHSWETIAMVMGYSSPASARNQKYKCLDKIKKQLASAIE